MGSRSYSIIQLVIDRLDDRVAMFDKMIGKIRNKNCLSPVGSISRSGLIQRVLANLINDKSLLTEFIFDSPPNFNEQLVRGKTRPVNISLTAFEINWIEEQSDRFGFHSPSHFMSYVLDNATLTSGKTNILDKVYADIKEEIEQEVKRNSNTFFDS